MDKGIQFGKERHEVVQTKVVPLCPYPLENDHANLVWDFELNLRKTATSRRPDLGLEDKEKKILWICDIACPQEKNTVREREEKR